MKAGIILYDGLVKLIAAKVNRPVEDQENPPAGLLLYREFGPG